MANRKKPTDRNRMTIEPAPNSPGSVIDPTDPHAQRRFQIQQRGGAYSDRMRINPFRQGYYQRKGYVPGRRSRRRTTRT